MLNPFSVGLTLAIGEWAMVLGASYISLIISLQYRVVCVM
jgi:hypothetical protein